MEHTDAAVLHMAVVDDEMRLAEIRVRLDDDRILAAADVIRLVVGDFHRQAFFVRVGMRLDDGRLVVRLAVADGAEFLIGDERLLLRDGHAARHQRQKSHSANASQP